MLSLNILLSFTFALAVTVHGGVIKETKEVVLVVGEQKFDPEVKVPGLFPANSSVCYDEVGCFDNFPPFNNAGNYLPVEPEEINPEFLLFTRKNLENEEYLNYKDESSILNSKFDRNQPLKLIIHGFGNNKSTPWIHDLKNAILNEENVNIIVVAWGNGSVFPLYNNAVANTRLVGRVTSFLLNKIKDLFYQSNTKDYKVHCIGHSLGAHTCGYAAKNSNFRFLRISALDPAGPCFEDTEPSVRVNPNDANFVDAIHSNAGSLLSASFGMIMPTGHIDFYPNGGKSQPGCPGLTSIIGGALGGSIDPSKEVGCSHNRVLQLYKESISSPCAFLGFSCPTQALFDAGQCISCADNKCSQMGYYADKFKGRGTMFLNTNAEKPYCGIHHMFEMTVSANSNKTAGDLLLSFKTNSNNSTKLTAGEDIVPNTVVRKVFVIEHDLLDVGSVNLTFIKKGKPLFGSDPNAKSFFFDRLNVKNIQIDETFSNCDSKREIGDKQSIEIPMPIDGCKTN